MSQLFDIVERETRATPEELALMKRGLVDKGVLRSSAQRLLDELPAPGRPPQLEAPVRRFRLPPLVLEVTALTLAAVVAWMAVDTFQQPEVAPAPETVAHFLESEVPVAMASTALVHLDYAGRGEVRGTTMDQEIIWDTGKVSVSVEPDQGVSLVVRTPEASVRVVGTVFAVTRDALGTTVEVERGAVAVDCEIGGEVKLTAGEVHTCWPTNPGALLGREITLEDLGATPAERLATLDLALSLDPWPSMRRNLEERRDEVLEEIDVP